MTQGERAGREDVDEGAAAVRAVGAASERFVTMHIQRDGRITLGTCVHLDRECHQLKSRTGVTGISGEIVQRLPKCSCCYDRDRQGRCNHERAPYA